MVHSSMSTFIATLLLLVVVVEAFTTTTNTKSFVPTKPWGSHNTVRSSSQLSMAMERTYIMVRIY